jgi:hypothetical protein
MLPSSLSQRARSSHRFIVSVFADEALERGGEAVQPRSIEERLTMLERQMQEMRDLPERVTKLELQVLQLRHEMQRGFSAIQSELKEGLSQLGDQLGAQMRMLHEETLSRIAVMGEGRRSRKR